MDIHWEEVIAQFVRLSALTIEVLAVAIIVVAVMGGMARYLFQAVMAHQLINERFIEYKLVLGRALLLGLTILVAADIIKTVALDVTLEGVTVLGILILIRVFLGWSLTVEMEGRWPWQHPAASSESGMEPPAHLSSQ